MQKETNIRKLENGRAEFAYKSVDFVRACLNKKEEPLLPECQNYTKLKDYRSYIKKIPVWIQTNGLGNTLAYMKSKGGDDKKNAYDRIYETLSAWLKECELLPREKDLLEYVVSQPSDIYRQFTTESLALLNWLRRLAEGMIKEEDENAS